MTGRAKLWISIGLVVASLAAGPVSPAHAVTVLATPTMGITGGDFARCRIVNLGTRGMLVGIELWTTSGDLVFHENFAVQPRSIGTAGWLANPALNGYCKFTGTFTKDQVRASIELRPVRHHDQRARRPGGLTRPLITWRRHP